MFSPGCFRHLVFQSILQPVRKGISSHIAAKVAIEELVQESKIPYTIVHAAPLMDDVITPSHIRGERNTLTTFLDPDMAFSYVSKYEVEEALANILFEREKHFYATYQLVGTPDPLNMHEIAAKASKILEQPMLPNKVDIVDVRKAVRHGELTFPGARPHEVDEGATTIIPPLNIGPSHMSQHLTVDGEQAVQSSASLTELASGYDGQRETAMLRRHALPPDEPRPTRSELAAEDDKQENAMTPRDQHAQSDTTELHHEHLRQENMSLPQADRIPTGGPNPGQRRRS